MIDIQRLVEIPGLPATRSLAYANAVIAGDFVFVAGQAGVDQHGALVSAEFEPEARRTFENIEVALRAAGSTGGA